MLRHIFCPAERELPAEYINHNCVFDWYGNFEFVSIVSTNSVWNAWNLGHDRRDWIYDKMTLYCKRKMETNQYDIQILSATSIVWKNRYISQRRVSFNFGFVALIWISFHLQVLILLLCVQAWWGIIGVLPSVEWTLCNEYETTSDYDHVPYIIYI